MKRAIVAIAALLATACGGSTSQPITAEEARTAMPAASQAQIPTPGNRSSVTALTVRDGSTEAAAAVHTAEYAASTIALATVVNGSIGFWLGVVDTIVGWEPTTCADDTCTWGPGAGAWDVNVYQLVVTRKADRDYLWKLQGYPKSDATKTFVTFISGEAFTTGTRHVGSGTIKFDFDQGNKLARLTDEPTQQGSIEAQYDNRSGLKLAMQAIDTLDAHGHATRTAYAFVSSATGGDLEVATRDSQNQDTLRLHSAWDAQGAGRGDANFSNAPLAVTYARTQCWDTSATLFNVKYQVSTPADTSSDMGDVSSCGAFSTALPLTLQIP